MSLCTWSGPAATLLNPTTADFSSAIVKGLLKDKCSVVEKSNGLASERALCRKNVGSAPLVLHRLASACPIAFATSTGGKISRSSTVSTGKGRSSDLLHPRCRPNTHDSCSCSAKGLYTYTVPDSLHPTAPIDIRKQPHTRIPILRLVLLK